MDIVFLILKNISFIPFCGGMTNKSLQLSGLNMSKNMVASCPPLNNTINNSLNSSQITLKLASGIFPNYDYKKSARLKINTLYDSYTQEQRSKMIHEREQRFLNKKNDPNYGSMLLKFEQDGKDNIELSRLELHRVLTPDPVIYYEKQTISREESRPPSAFFYLSRTKNDEMKAAGNFDDLLQTVNGCQSKRLKAILEKRSKTDIQQKLKRRKAEGELSLDNIVTKQKWVPHPLSMYERAQIMLQPKKYEQENPEDKKYILDPLARDMIRKVQTEKKQTNIMRKISGVY